MPEAGGTLNNKTGLEIRQPRLGSIGLVNCDVAPACRNARLSSSAFVS
jgi:hypothetical protein